MTKRALICGVSGQDGAYLARHLLDKGYQVFGTSRDAELSSFAGLKALGIHDQVRTRSMSSSDFRTVIQMMTEVEPDEIYNLAGQTSVGLSFTQPVETMDSVAIGTLNLLEAIRMLKAPIRFYNAASGECFGHTTRGNPARENSPLSPRSPYGVAKCAAFWEVAAYRESYGMFACSGLLFNHESPLRPQRFVTRKVVSAALRIANGSKERLTLGETRMSRDWGYAAEYVDAMWRMLQTDTPDDYVIATGRSHTLGDFVDTAFGLVGLDWRDHTDSDPAFFRAGEIMSSVADPSRAHEKLGWRAQTRMADVVALMLEAEGAAVHAPRAIPLLC